ncbi:hypothetical protein [Ammoniphilus sp. CFH 90114]|nr:hypothetical protein [Ammoniphilus sp. CFH 90114]
MKENHPLEGKAPLESNPIDPAFKPKENEQDPKFRLNEPLRQAQKESDH